MNFTKQIVASVAAAVVVVLVAFGLYHPSTTVIQQVPSNTPQTIVRGTSPEFTSPYIVVNGVTEWYQRKDFNFAQNGATTTLCSFASPFATSTLAASTSPQLVTLRLTSPATTSMEIDIGTSTNGFSTSSTNFIKNFLPSANATNTAAFWINPGGAGSMWQNNNESIVVYAAQVGLSSTLAGTCQLESTQY